MEKMELHFIWVENKEKYQTGESVYLNRICVGGYEWNSTRSKTDANRDGSNDWRGYITLPQISRGIYGENQAAVKAEVERIVKGWFGEATKKKEE